MVGTQPAEGGEEVPSIPTHRFAKFNPFRDDDDEGGDELGEETDENTVAGGGRATGGAIDIATRKKLHVSHALARFLAEQGELSKDDVAGIGDDDTPNSSAAVQAILARPQVQHPKYVNDRNHFLSEYLISSSHNTYLVGKQLYGSADASTYKRHLAGGARCVEIDAWDSDDKAEPKVTHGYTLTEHVSFRDVCGAINTTMEDEIKRAGQNDPPLPIFISLENHCSPPCQLRLAAIMREVFGAKLVSEPVHKDGSEATLKDVCGRILVMVEYYGSGQADVEEAAGESQHNAKDAASKEIRDKNAEAKPAKIVPELAAIGVYAQSMKPSDDKWTRNELKEPANHLVNVEERAVQEAIKNGSAKGVAEHNAHHLMRIYPKGTRINSENLNPVPFWSVGAQVCALNWQTFDAAMQLNEALFAGTEGWVLKPPHLRRQPGPKPTGKIELTLEIAGASNLPVPAGRETDIKPYITCTLYHPSNLDKPEKKKTAHYRVHKHKQLLFGKEQPPPTSPVWDPPAKLQWTYEEDDLAFLRVLIKSDDAFARNPAFLCSAIRLGSIPQGWHFVRMLDMRGGETRGTLLVRYLKKKV